MPATIYETLHQPVDGGEQMQKTARKVDAAAKQLIVEAEKAKTVEKLADQGQCPSGYGLYAARGDL